MDENKSLLGRISTFRKEVNDMTDTSVYTKITWQRKFALSAACVFALLTMKQPTLTLPLPKKFTTSSEYPRSSPYNFPGHNISWFEELVPQSIQPAFKKTFLDHNYTANFMRSTRQIVGNVQRLRNFLRKVKSGQCTNGIVFGGSVTVGHNAGGVSASYHQQFVNWLNEKYPCSVTLNT